MFIFIPKYAQICSVKLTLKLLQYVVHKNQHYALSFVNIRVFITNAAPTCFGTYVPSSGSVFVLVST
jgi:hypothetical protein